MELPKIVPPHYVEQEVYDLQLVPGEHRDLEIRVLPKLRIIRPLGDVSPPLSYGGPQETGEDSSK